MGAFDESRRESTTVSDGHPINDGVSLSSDCLRQENGLYRVNVGIPTVLGGDFVNFGDLVEIGEERDGMVPVARVVEKGKCRSWEWLLPESFDWESVYEYGRRVEDHGGSWDRMCGGILIIHLPQDSPLDPELDLAHLFGRT